MKIRELIEILKNFNQDDEIVIEGRTPQGGFFVGTTHKDIEHVWQGIDWDSGKIFLHPKKIKK